jgi:hypothetical protein
MRYYDLNVCNLSSLVVYRLTKMTFSMVTMTRERDEIQIESATPLHIFMPSVRNLIGVIGLSLFHAVLVPLPLRLLLAAADIPSTLSVCGTDFFFGTLRGRSIPIPNSKSFSCVKSTNAFLSPVNEPRPCLITLERKIQRSPGLYSILKPKSGRMRSPPVRSRQR